MAVVDLIMPDMATNKKAGQGKRGRPPGRKPKYLIYARISPKLGAALEEMLERTRRTQTTEVEIALEEYLEKHGLWSRNTTEE